MYFAKKDPDKASLTDDWKQFIVRQIEEKKAVPIISNRIHNQRVLGSDAAVARGFSEHRGYGPIEPHKLAELTQYISTLSATAGAEVEVKRAYLDYCKKHLIEQARADAGLADQVDEAESLCRESSVSELAQILGYPQFGEPTRDPLLILARLKLPIYLTTSYHEFLERALIKANRKPRTRYCQWHRNQPAAELDTDTEHYEPSVEEPLVYHLHGLDRDPESLVLTEDDYLAYLVAISRDIGRPTDRIARRVREALTGSSLILLGYDLSAWDFRTLLWGLIKERQRPSQSVCVLQLGPEADDAGYLEQYLKKVAFKVFHGDLESYTHELDGKVDA